MSSSPATSNIQYISINTIKPANKTDETGFMDLTPWDLMTLPIPYIQRGLLFSKPQIHQDKESNSTTTPKLINDLMKSFSCTLDYFPPLAGRLALEKHQDDVAISFVIDCNAVGAQFIHARAQVTVADVLEDSFYVHEIVFSFFPLNGVFNYEGKSQPLLAVQVTELVDGIFIGCCINHVIVDGTSFWHFMNCWSEISRAASLDDHVPSRLPILKRWFFDETDLPIRYPPSIEDYLAARRHISLESLCQKGIFHFTPQKIAQLKLQANAERETDKISSLQAVLGHVWITITRARCGDHANLDVVHQMHLAIGNRTRVNPSLPQEYFGNSIQGVKATSKAGELLVRGLGWAAWLLNQAVSSHGEADVRSHWESKIKKPFLVYFPPTVEIPTNLAVGSSPRFDMYGNNFGWGRPVAVRSGRPYTDGEILVHPGAVEGSMDIELSLSPQTLKAIRDYNTDFT